jgi:hypothetical protein
MEQAALDSRLRGNERNMLMVDISSAQCRLSAMLAYVFWHRPLPHVDRKLYEDAIVRFQSDLARQPPPGFIAAMSFRIEPVSWLGDQGGYEDWCLLDGSWAMDSLNNFAATGRMQPSHDGVAAHMDEGHGGLYAHAGGEPSAAAESTIYWLTRPRGISWQDAIAPLRARFPQVNVWRRQMVLGPTAEFAVEAPDHAEIDVPKGWTLSQRVRRVRVMA